MAYEFTFDDPISSDRTFDTGHSISLIFIYSAALVSSNFLSIIPPNGNTTFSSSTTTGNALYFPDSRSSADGFGLGGGNFALELVTATTTSWTVSVWVKNLKSPTGDRVLFWGNSEVFQVYLPAGSGVLTTRFITSSRTFSYRTLSSNFDLTSVFADGGWHHLAIVAADNIGTLYVDGASRGTYNFPQDRLDIMVVGNNGNQNSSFADYIEELRIYHRAQTPTEIMLLFNNGLALQGAPPCRASTAACSSRQPTTTCPTGTGSPAACVTVCQNNATCQDDFNNGSAVPASVCICQPGWTGELCNININDCTLGVCQNGGVCIDGVNSFTVFGNRCVVKKLQ